MKEFTVIARLQLFYPQTIEPSEKENYLLLGFSCRLTLHPRTLFLKCWEWQCEQRRQAEWYEERWESVTPPPNTCTPFPGELDQGQCAALAEKIKHGLSVGQTAGQVNGASEAAGHLISTDIRGHPCLSQSTQAVNDKWAWNYFICCFVYIYELHDHSTKRTKAHLFLSNKCSVEFFGVYSEAQNETHLGRVTSKCYSCHYLTVTAL